ncbi:MAG: hypothetical protein JW995_02800 [Melioribacteraceae bacterium]|nr:hypothetical protein [Melioribacteraceae bacterium]
MIFILSLAGSSASNNRFDSLIVSGINQIYNIKLDAALNTFNTLKKEFSNHPSGYFFEAMVLWWEIVLNTSTEEFDDEFIDKLEHVIDMCDEILDTDPQNIDALFFKGGALGFRGRLYSLRESWFNAALDGKDALPIVYKASEIDPLNPDIQLGFGIYNYYAAVIPEKYPVIKPFMVFFPNGDKEKGLEQLDFVAQNGKYAKIESIYFLATSHYSFEENYQMAFVYTEQLTERFPDNPRFQSLKGRLWIKMNNYKMASIIFKNILDKCDAGLYGYNKMAEREASYYVGAYYDRIGQADSSRYFFERCENVSRQIEEDETSGFLINSLLYLGRLNKMKGSVNKAEKYYEEVFEYRDYNGSHEKAERELELLKKGNKLK